MVTNKSGTLYIGLTNNLERRIAEHKSGHVKGFTARYKLERLVYHEVYSDVTEAIRREKQLKGWRRARKIELIRENNPRWVDLAETWFNEGPDPSLRSG